MLPKAPTDTEPVLPPEPVGRKLWLWLLAVVGLLLVAGAVIYRWLRRLLAPEEKAMMKRGQDAEQTTAPVSAPNDTPAQLEPVAHGVRQAPALAPATDSDTEGKTAGYEPNDVSVRGVTMATIALFLMIAAGLVAVRGLIAVFGRLNPPPPPVTLVQPQRTPDVPALWFVPEADRQAYRVQEDAQLDSYGWVDQANGVAHIPITQAIQLVVEQGLPARDQAPPAFGFPQPSQLESAGGAAKERTESGAP